MFAYIFLRNSLLSNLLVLLFLSLLKELVINYLSKKKKKIQNTNKKTSLKIFENADLFY